MLWQTQQLSTPRQFPLCQRGTQEPWHLQQQLLQQLWQKELNRQQQEFKHNQHKRKKAVTPVQIQHHLNQRGSMM